jgi:succinyl-CoA synthetase beta subunit
VTNPSVGAFTMNIHEYQAKEILSSYGIAIHLEALKSRK